MYYAQVMPNFRGGMMGLTPPRKIIETELGKPASAWAKKDSYACCISNPLYLYCFTELYCMYMTYVHVLSTYIICALTLARSLRQANSLLSSMTSRWRRRRWTGTSSQDQGWCGDGHQDPTRQLEGTWAWGFPFRSPKSSSPWTIHDRS